MDILKHAVKEVSETGKLSFSSRRKLWLALGPCEERDEMDSTPCLLTEPLKKRTELALACAKKVSRIWSSYDLDDKRPQQLNKQIRAYLDGKITQEALQAETYVIKDFMSVADKEHNDSSPAAALASWNALVVALQDEPLLDPRYADATDDDLDFYDWDAAKYASVAWRDSNNDGDPTKRAIQEIKFWAWYLEEVAKLLGDENFKFPAKYIKSFIEKQAPPRPIPQDTTIESLCDYLGAGKYLYHVLSLPGLYDEPSVYKMITRVYGESGICPICKKETGQFRCIATFYYLKSQLPNTDIPLHVIKEAPVFNCPDHPHEWCLPSTPKINPNSALKNYLKENGRKKALLEQLNSRAVNACELLGGTITLNGNDRPLQVIDRVNFPKEQGAYWLDKKRELYQIDLTLFGSQVYFERMPYEEFCQRCPEQVKQLDDGSVELTMNRYWVTCHFNATGTLERVVLRSRFHIWITELDNCQNQLTKLLPELIDNLNEKQATQSISAAEQVLTKEWVIPVLSGLEKEKAITLCDKLKKHGILCRIVPTPIEDL